MSAESLALAFLVGGGAGWFLENVATGEPRFSHAFGDARVPFLPVYGFGTAAIVAAAPRMGKVSAPIRFIIYASGLSAIELAACAVDRRTGDASWNYNCEGDFAECKRPENLEGCVSWKHAAIWGALGLAVDAVARKIG